MTHTLVRVLVALCASAALAGCGPSAAPPPGSGTAPRAQAPPVARSGVAAPDFTALVENVGPAVVNVTTTRTVTATPHLPPGTPDSLREFFRRFAPPQEDGSREFRSQGIGSGFIIEAQGYVLTNAHVVEDADEVLVRLAGDKSDYKARVVGSDLQTDVALLKVDATGLPVVRLGDSSQLKAGAWVAAIGSPFGLANTITAGIVSATQRSLADETFVPFIQTDVAVNPGNSGGPLLNANGEVVGINSQIYSRTGGYMGLSFAIPIAVALDVAGQLRTQGKVTRGRIGVAIQEVSEPLARSFGLDKARGALVTAVQPDSPARQAGLAAGDIIVRIDGKEVGEAAELPRLVAQARPGSEVPVQVWRDGRPYALNVTIGQAPTQAARPAPPPARPSQAPRDGRLGLQVRELSAEGRRALGLDYGLVVEGVAGPNAEAPLQRGDVIIALNNRRFYSLADFNRRLDALPPGAAVAALVRRGGTGLYVPLTVGAG
ncbi:MAG TPA: Do family serine endopeptidase [Burkholderiaceae bacterium]|nr:Do family serine endopeptidase [Burkholderiaceae bacterium]